MTINNKKIRSIAFIYLFLGIIIFALAYISIIQKQYLYDFNKPILDWFLSVRQPIISSMAKLLTNLASATSLTLITIIITLMMIFYKKEFLRPLLLLGTMTTAVLVSTLMKVIIMNSRPLQQNMVPSYQLDYSFPSGHTLGIWIFLLTIGYLFYSRKFSFKKYICWNLFAVLLTSIIAITRLYLGYHWLTDIVASVGLGLIIFSAMIFMDKFITSSLNTDQ
ncbi:MAG: phosphatase PAP2 family protein [Candidatus Saccharimonadales bacterium]